MERLKDTIIREFKMDLNHKKMISLKQHLKRASNKDVEEIDSQKID